MNPRLRRVAKLRLRSPGEALNQRGAILIEDALHTASLPDSDGARVLVIRKLSLGRIRASDASASIALRIEARCREAGRCAVHALSPEAVAAPAVYFDDDLEPYALLAVRIACNLPVSAWFWPLAARGWNPLMSRDEAMRVLLTGALASTAGPIAALSMMRALARHNALGNLASALRHQDGAPLLQAFAWTAPARALAHSSLPIERPADSPSAALEQMALPWIAAWGSDDARSLWLACVLYSIERPALFAHASLPVKAAAWIASIRAASPDVAPATAMISFSRPSESDSPRKIDGAITPEDQTAPSLHPRSRLVTHSAGLFYLIQVIQRLGMATWLDANPDLASWDIPHLILRGIARRLETPQSDPVFAVLGEPPESPPAEVDHAVQEWIRRIRRFCRRTAGIGLYALVCRPGRLSFTETHIDVLFSLDRVDIRIRGSGLDIDPGWVPWFSRVVLFHYVDLEVADAG